MLRTSEDLGSLPVVQGGQLVAVLTDRDIVVRAVAESADPSATKVGDIASGRPVTIESDENLDEAPAQMARAQVRRLPVVEGGRLVRVRRLFPIVPSEAGRDADCSITRFSETRPRQGSKDPRR
jgi:CBS domain-containing protein